LPPTAALIVDAAAPSARMLQIVAPIFASVPGLSLVSYLAWTPVTKFSCDAESTGGAAAGDDDAAAGADTAGADASCFALPHAASMSGSAAIALAVLAFMSSLPVAG
jgi:hypothetical protein